jgi:hypothetical protein
MRRIRLESRALGEKHDVVAGEKDVLGSAHGARLTHGNAGAVRSTSPTPTKVHRYAVLLHNRQLNIHREKLGMGAHTSLARCASVEDHRSGSIL